MKFKFNAQKKLHLVKSKISLILIFTFVAFSSFSALALSPPPYRDKG